MLRKTSAAAAALVLLATAACARGNGKAFEPEVRNDEIPMKLTVVVKGDLDATVRERTVKTRVIVLEGDGDQIQSTFGIQPLEPMAVGELGVLPGVAVLPFKGDGKYTIKVGAPSDLLKGGGQPDPTKIGSSVRLEWWPSSTETFEYQRRAKPCTVEIEDDGLKGRVTCPDVTGEPPAPHFSLDFRWEKP